VIPIEVVPTNIYGSGWQDERLARASPDLLRAVVRPFAGHRWATRLTRCAALAMTSASSPSSTRSSG
jgi:hypothetical protein